jgi:hypothetical protein
MNASGVKRLIEAWQKDCSNDTQSDPIDFQSAGFSTDVIDESTSGSGVRIDIMKILDRGIDTSSAGTLTVGAATATGVQIGASDITTTVNGGLALAGAGSVAPLTIDVDAVAATGSTQANAIADANATVSATFSYVTGADNTKCIVLPTASTGRVCIIKNTSATAHLPVFPNLSDSINGAAANAALNVPAGTACMLVAYNAVNWFSIPALPS